MNVQIIKVYLVAHSQERLVGTLAYKDKKIYFEYDPIFLSSNIEYPHTNYH
jgi:hypothetical protein